MQLSGVFSQLGEAQFNDLVRGISIGKLKTYQIYEGFKVRAHMAKLNTETLRKAAPRLWTRVTGGDEDFAKDLAQSVLVSHLDMIVDVLDLLGIPHENGFFSKDLDASKYLTDGWQKRVFDAFHGKYPKVVLLFYINHLAWELTSGAEPFVPAA